MTCSCACHLDQGVRPENHSGGGRADLATCFDEECGFEQQTLADAPQDSLIVAWRGYVSNTGPGDDAGERRISEGRESRLLQRPVNVTANGIELLDRRRNRSLYIPIDR